VDAAAVRAEAAIDADARERDAHAAIEARRAGAEVREQRSGRRFGAERHALRRRLAYAEEVDVDRADRVPRHVDLAVRSDDRTRALYAPGVAAGATRGQLQRGGPRADVRRIGLALDLDAVRPGAGEVERGVREVEVAARRVGDDPRLVEEERRVRK